jgi:hypothetical protein
MEYSLQTHLLGALRLNPNTKTSSWWHNYPPGPALASTHAWLLRSCRSIQLAVTETVQPDDASFFTALVMACLGTDGALYIVAQMENGDTP